MTDSIGCVVAGAGVIGLAVARALAMAGHEVLVLEAAGGVGTGTSSRNSEVIHAGLYYTPGSWRAWLCAPGRRALYAYCGAHGVATRRTGKLIVATTVAELGALASIAERGAANGVEGLRCLSAAEARALEPALACTGALLSPETGIVDAHGLMLSLRGEAADHGAVFAFAAPLEGASAVPDGFVLFVGGKEAMRLHTRVLVNAAGHGACALAGRIKGLEARLVPRPYLAKGSYFSMSGKSPFQRLIYPVPVPGGAGIHLTLDMAGAPRFGPDVEAVERFDYTVDPGRAGLFEAAIRRYWPGLPSDALQPAYAGIRPKIVPPDQAQDFVLQGPEVHGLPGLVNLFGIESPGLTASLAIGETVAGFVA